MFKNNIWQIGDILRYDYCYPSSGTDRVYGIITEKIKEERFRVIWLDGDCTTERPDREEIINIMVE